MFELSHRCFARMGHPAGFEICIVFSEPGIRQGDGGSGGPPGRGVGFVVLPRVPPSLRLGSTLGYFRDAPPGSFAVQFQARLLLSHPCFARMGHPAVGVRAFPWFARMGHPAVLGDCEGQRDTGCCFLWLMASRSFSRRRRARMNSRLMFSGVGSSSSSSSESS